MKSASRQPATGKLRQAGALAGELATDQQGATTLEWALLLGGVGIPMYFAIQLMMNLLMSYYGMMTTLNALPLP
ncbi:MAG: hypothetical protein IT440_08905 [Phycisphaeraceae bacterium]|nr:hypothetical protein [Phycisphaeraceae bacterium]